MGDEVTKKDLQSLQGYCNKQIADVNKRIDNASKCVTALAKQVETNNSSLTDGINNVMQASKENDTIQAAALAKQVAALEARVAALEK
jgi:uncharacterized protein involved in exopolysaccharide biosynthesis